MPSKKKVAAIVKIAIPAGSATPAPPVGTALGPHGVNIMEFVKAYNARTESQRGTIVPAEITIYEDRSFTFIIKTPPAAELIKRLLEPRRARASRTRPRRAPSPRTRFARSPPRNCPTSTNDVEAAMKIVEGTARSMGVTVS